MPSQDRESAELSAVLAFVSGEMPPEDFRRELARRPEFASLLDDAKELPKRSYVRDTLAGMRWSGPVNTYEFIRKIDLTSPGGVLNAQGALTQFLDRRGISYKKTEAYSEFYGLLLDAQPAWLDVDPAFLRQLLEEAPDQSKSARKKWLRAQLNERFRFATKPPRWIQSPQWPIRDGRPLVFLGQFPLKDYFHDEAAVYVFHDPDTGDFETIVQVY